ncbi:MULTISPECIES: hypothetical protein [Streptomyces]|uniref:Uncharacterized protein n=1 Tax=Streptomyces dengpaensis TaxID=2049881 RepID=A0ABN5IAA8_9ACTN|nr:MULTISPECIES: hypothetical protein [Streptomyces]AVH59916.1 hypothetical protein C4B68_33745 [Streptomyces dengpaensis]PIB09551.1 hypothetical protein B1C81_10420 [Streptomyces sp. HG99]
MTAKLTGGVTFLLDDGPIRTRYGRSEFTGKPTAWLALGDSDGIEISVTDSSAETLAQLEEAVAELRAWAKRQERLAALPEVA